MTRNILIFILLAFLFIPNLAFSYQINAYLAPRQILQIKTATLGIELFLNAIGINSINELHLRSERLPNPLEMNKDISVFRLKVTPSSSKQTLPLGESILPFELGGEEFFDFLFYKKRLIGIFPDKNGSSYINASYLSIDVPQPPQTKEEAEQSRIQWQLLSRIHSEDLMIIERYKSATKRSELPEKEKNEKNRFTLARFSNGSPRILNFSLDQIQNEPQLLDELTHLDPDTLSIIFPIYPTVYNPGTHMANKWGVTFDTDDYWYKNLEWELRSYLKRASLENPQALVLGPGSGIDSMLTALITKQKSIPVSGINPFEVANTKYLLTRAGINNDVRIFNSLYDTDSQTWAHSLDEIDLIVWNMPALTNSEPQSNMRSYRSLHDKTGSQEALNRLVAGLEAYIEKNGYKRIRVILWNTSANIYKPDGTEAAFANIGWEVVGGNSDSLNADGNIYVFEPRQPETEKTRIKRAPHKTSS